MVKAITPLPNDNHYKELCEETLDTPMPAPDLKSRILENKQIRKLAVEQYNERQCVEIVKELHDQLKMLLQNKPIKIPDPAKINHAALMNMEHNARLEFVHKLMPPKEWGTPKHRAILESLELNSVYLSKINSIRIKFLLSYY